MLEPAIGFNVEDFLFIIDNPVPHNPVSPVPFFFQLQPESLFFDVLIESFRQFIGDVFWSDNNADFSIVVDCPRIKIQGADKNKFAVKDK